MPVMDEFKKEREKIKNAPLKEKLSYFWCYYKWHTIGILIGIGAVISIVYSIVTHKDIAFYSVMLNSYGLESAKEYTENVAEYLEIDTTHDKVLFDSEMFIDHNSRDQQTVSASQKIMVYLATSEIDMMITDVNSLQHYAYLDTFTDLREFLTPEQVDKYMDRFYYIDYKVISSKQSADENDAQYQFKYPEDSFDPDSMIDPVPVGIKVTDCPDIADNFLFQKGEVVLSVAVNTVRKDLVLKYIDYLFRN